MKEQEMVGQWRLLLIKVNTQNTCLQNFITSCLYRYHSNSVPGQKHKRRSCLPRTGDPVAATDMEKQEGPHPRRAKLPWKHPIFSAEGGREGGAPMGIPL